MSYFLELYFMHWIGCLAILIYEICKYLFGLWKKSSWRFLYLPRVSCVNRCQMADQMTGHSKVLQWSKVNLFWLQIGRCIQHASFKVEMSYLCHLVISIAIVWVINHFSPRWNICICILMEYFGGSKSIPHQPPGKAKTDRMACVAAR